MSTNFFYALCRTYVKGGKGGQGRWTSTKKGGQGGCPQNVHPPFFLTKVGVITLTTPPPGG